MSVYAAIQYFAIEKGRARFLGNSLIAIGALLPGICRTFTRFGYVEVLYITELCTYVMDISSLNIGPKP